MTTFLMFITKRDDLTLDEFRRYYEGEHIRLVARLVGAGASAYRRHHRLAEDPLLDALVTPRGDAVAPYSAVTELVFADEDAARATVDRLTSSPVMEQVLADEANFIAPGGIQWLAVRTRE